MLRRQWIEDRDGFLMVYSIVDKTSFDDLSNFYELIEQVKEDQLEKGVPLVLVANKADLVEVGCSRAHSLSLLCAHTLTPDPPPTTATQSHQGARQGSRARMECCLRRDLGQVGYQRNAGL